MIDAGEPVTPLPSPMVPGLETDELEQLAAGRREGLQILEGWRFDEFGRDALDLVEGRLAFAIKNGKLVMTRTEAETIS